MAASEAKGPWGRRVRLQVIEERGDKLRPDKAEAARVAKVQVMPADK